MGDSHFCKWEFGSPKEYSEKPTKQEKKKEKAQTSTTTNPRHWSRKCFSGHWCVWAVPVSVCFCSGLCTELCLSPSFLSQTLRASSVELLTESLLSFFGFHPRGPCASPCASPVINIAISMPKIFCGLGTDSLLGLWVRCLQAAGGAVLCAHSKTKRFWTVVFSLQELLQWVLRLLLV